VPEILCVSGDVALTCITVTRPMAKPMKPVSVMLNQKSAENSLAVLSRIIYFENERQTKVSQNHSGTGEPQHHQITTLDQEYQRLQNSTHHAPKRANVMSVPVTRT
jgi:3-methyladenine DNA glycosylase AlkC